MRKLGVFNSKNKDNYYMPDDTRIDFTDTGIAFYSSSKPSHAILWLPIGWGYVWMDDLET